MDDTFSERAGVVISLRAECVDGCIPSDLAAGTTEAIEEERWLLYVAMTRAKNHLDLLVPHRFYVSSQRSHGDRHMYASRSCFLPDGILPLFQCRSWPAAEQEANSPTMESKVGIDIGARLIGLIPLPYQSDLAM
jgi:DNA helicase-2/ATP-dependent DNA helicase PcrA